MVTKPLQKLENNTSYLIRPVPEQIMAPKGSEVKSHKTLEQLNIAFEKKNTLFCRNNLE